VSETSDAHLDADPANAAAVRAFTALDAGSIALLLDVDGTLIDIGPTPFEVDVSDTLKQSLARLMHLTGGAIALVSGRPIRDLDRLFAPLMLPAVGGHGAEMRVGEGVAASRVADLPAALRRAADRRDRSSLGSRIRRQGYIRLRCITERLPSTRSGCARTWSRPALRFRTRTPRCFPEK